MGRGLAAILPRASAGDGGLREIPTELIKPNPRQPRRSFDESALVELAESIRARGLLQPVVVRSLPGGHYELVAGERRLRAARIAELESIPAVVREADDWERLDLALAENMARVDLNAVEEARACAMLVDDLGLTKEEVGRRVGRSRVAISNLIRLLDLPEEALDLIETGELSEGHGRAVSALQGPRGAPPPRPRRSRRVLVRARDRAPRPRDRDGRRGASAPANRHPSGSRRGPGRRRRRPVGRIRAAREGQGARRRMPRGARLREPRRGRGARRARATGAATIGRSGD